MWRIDLKPADRQRAQVHVAALAEELMKPSSDALDNAERALFFGAVESQNLDTGGNQFPGPDHFLSVAINQASDENLSPALLGGFVQIAWTNEHFPDSYGASARDAVSDVDQLLLDAVSDDQARVGYDHQSGVVGIGIYGLERARNADVGHEIVRRVVRRLRDTAVHVGPGICWKTPAHTLPSPIRAAHPVGLYNLGLPHGVAGVIGFLSSVGDLVGENSKELLTGAVRWLLDQRNPLDWPSAFPFVADACFPRTHTRLGWCYGDSVLALILLRAARRLADPALESYATRLAREASVRTRVGTVRSVGVCHGTAGQALIYQRLNALTPCPALQDAARFWIGQTLRLLECGTAADHTKDLVNGTIGAACALLAASSDVAPAWDRLLGLSS